MMQTRTQMVIRADSYIAFVSCVLIYSVGLWKKSSTKLKYEKMDYSLEDWRQTSLEMCEKWAKWIKTYEK